MSRRAQPRRKSYAPRAARWHYGGRQDHSYREADPTASTPLAEVVRHLRRLAPRPPEDATKDGPGTGTAAPAADRPRRGAVGGHGRDGPGAGDGRGGAAAGAGAVGPRCGPAGRLRSGGRDRLGRGVRPPPPPPATELGKVARPPLK